MTEKYCNSMIPKLEIDIFDKNKQEILTELSEKLKNNISQRRYIHSVNVMNCSIQLAKRYNAEIWDAAVAGLLHDCGKEIDDNRALELSAHYGIEVDEISALQPDLLHGKIGAFIAMEQYLREDFGINTETVLSAIRWHTTGIPGMSQIDTIIFLADFIEPERNFAGLAEIQKEAFIDLYRAALMAMDSTVLYILRKGRPLHPDTIFARNWLIIEKINKKAAK